MDDLFVATPSCLFTPDSITSSMFWAIFLYTLKLPRGNLRDHSSFEKIGEHICCWPELL